MTQNESIDPSEVKAHLNRFALKFSELIHPFDISSIKNKEPEISNFQNTFTHLANYLKDNWQIVDNISNHQISSQKQELKMMMISTILRAFVDDPIITDKIINELSLDFFKDIHDEAPNLEMLKLAKKNLCGKLFSQYLYSNAQTITQELADLLAITLSISKRDKFLYAVEELVTPSYFSLPLSKKIKDFKKYLLTNDVTPKDETTPLEKKTIYLSAYDPTFKTLLNGHHLKNGVEYIIDDEAWPTVEHYYQIQKFKNHPNYHQIKSSFLKVPAESLQKDLEKNNLIPSSNWFIKEPLENLSERDLFNAAINNEYGLGFFVMAKALIQKFYHPNERAILLKTKNYKLSFKTDEIKSIEKQFYHDPLSTYQVISGQKNYFCKLLEGLRALINEGTY